MTRDDIIRMAREAGFFDPELTQVLPSVERFAALVAAAEREACAKVCEYYFSHGARDIADAIRARGQQ